MDKVTPALLMALASVYDEAAEAADCERFPDFSEVNSRGAYCAGGGGLCGGVPSRLAVDAGIKRSVKKGGGTIHDVAACWAISAH